jgi:hypothetical protein
MMILMLREWWQRSGGFKTRSFGVFEIDVTFI